MKEAVKLARDHFRTHYAHVALDQLSDLELNSFLNLSHVLFHSDGSPRPFSSKMNLLYDYVVSQDLVDVTP